MAYNTATRLLLKFNGSIADTSETAAATTLNGTGAVVAGAGVFGTGALLVGDPFGAEAGGKVVVTDPSAIFTNDPAPARRIDFWFKPEAYPASYYGTLLYIRWDNYANIGISPNYFGGISVDTNLGSLYGNFYPSTGQWHHLRLYIHGENWCLGIDGAEVAADTIAGGAWVGDTTNFLTDFHVGDHPDYADYSFRGYIDAVEVTEGDTSWTGGTYTVPTAEPDDFGGGGPVELLGQGENSAGVESTGDGVVEAGVVGQGGSVTDNVASTGAGLVVTPNTGVGANTTEGVISTGAGVLLTPNTGVGENTTGAITSTGFGGGNDIFTTLNILGNVADAPFYRDSSLYQQAVSSVSVSQDTTTPILGSGSLAFVSTNANLGGWLDVPLTGAMFVDRYSDKIIDCFVRLDGNTGTRTMAVWDAYFSADGGAYGNVARIALSIGPNSIGLFVSTLHRPPDVTSPILGFDRAGVITHVRAAFVGNTARLYIDGVLRGSLSTDDASPIWPQNVACSKFRLGQDANEGIGRGLQGSIDNFRVQEGTVANHGHTGADFSVPKYEWSVGLHLGAGANSVEGVTSLGAGLLINPSIGTGANTLDSTICAGDGVSGGLVSGIGANTLDSLTQSSVGELNVVRFGQATATLDNVTSVGLVALSFAGRGAAFADDVSSFGEGSVGFGVATGSGSSVTGAITSVGEGSVQITGVGANTTGVTNLGIADGGDYGAGSNTASVQSLGFGVCETLGAGVSSVADVTGAANGTVTVFGAGLSFVSVSSLGSGACPIYGSGFSFVADVTPERPALTDDALHIYAWKKQHTFNHCSKQQQITVGTR